MKKSISLLLCLCMLLSTLASCSNGSNSTDGKDTSSQDSVSENQANSDSVNSTDSEDTPERYTANIPAGTTYGGQTFTIATYPNDGGMWTDVDWSATETTGEALNDAAYSRMTYVEDLLDINIEPAYTTGPEDNTTLGISVTTNDGAYDLFTLNVGNVLSQAAKGYVQDLNTVADKGTLELTAPWWDQNIINDLSIANKSYGLTGDIGVLYKKSIAAIMFNKTILANAQLENPYTLMEEGKWTVDKMVELGSKVSQDLDGNGVRNTEDQYGLICFCDMLAIAMIGCDVPFFTKDENDMPVNTFFNDRSVAVLEKLSTLMYNTDLTYSWSVAGAGEDPAFKMFQTDKSLFYYGEMHAVETMRVMESPFGILPMPKYDEAQESYYHCLNPLRAATYVIPTTNVEYTMTGYILDALGAESKNVLTPAYYDRTLKGQISRDEESVASLNIILNTVRYDLGYLGGWGLSSMLNTMADSYSTDLASRNKSMNKVINKSVEKFIKDIEEIQSVSKQ